MSDTESDADKSKDNDAVEKLRKSLKLREPDLKKLSEKHK